MKQHFFATTSALALVLSGAAASAQDMAFTADNVSGDIVYYTHWTNYIASGDFDRWEAEFKAMYPNAGDIDIIGVATYAETMATRFATGEYGDVLEVANNLSIEELPDFLLPLTDLHLEDDMYFADRWATDGVPYGYTFGVNAEGIVYNKNAFAAAGITEVPTTWTAFTEAAAALKEHDIIPLITNMGSSWPITAWDGLAAAMSGDPDFFSNMADDPAPFAADRPYGRSLATLKTFIDNGWVEEDLTGDHWQDSKGWMASGEAAMWFLGNWSINQIVEEGAALAGVEGFDNSQLGYFPFPYDDEGNLYANSGPDWAMAINVGTENAPMAMAWVDFLLTKTDLAQIAGFIPGFKGLEPTLPQLAELNSYGPTLIGQNTPSSAYTDTTNLINFINGAGTRELMLADDYDAAVTALNERWTQAVARASR